MQKFRNYHSQSSMKRQNLLHFWQLVLVDRLIHFTALKHATLNSNRPQLVDFFRRQQLRWHEKRRVFGSQDLGTETIPHLFLMRFISKRHKRCTSDLGRLVGRNDDCNINTNSRGIAMMIME